jgi:hypothetical protein
LNILQKSSATERLDFTNRILNFANKQERKYVDSLLPALEFLVSKFNANSGLGAGYIRRKESLAKSVYPTGGART